jgi:hypothetical protein
MITTAKATTVVFVFDKEDPTYKEVSETTFRESYVMPD